MRRLTIAIVGPGRLGSTLADRLSRAGYKVSTVHRRRGRNFLKADLVWFCVPDGKIARTAADWLDQPWRGKLAFHSSGVLGSRILAPLARAGAGIASVHPLMTFVEGSWPSLAGVSFALEGDPAALSVAEKIVRRLGGESVRLRAENKAAYHAFATMVCPLLVAWLAAAEKTAALAGIGAKEARRRMMPIVRQTLDNYARLGPAGSSSGPVVRGDVRTLERHLKLLGKVPTVKEAYRALVKSALASLPAKNKRQISELVGELSHGAGKHSTPRS